MKWTQMAGKKLKYFENYAKILMYTSGGKL